MAPNLFDAEIIWNPCPVRKAYRIVKRNGYRRVETNGYLYDIEL